METLAELISRNAQSGRVEWIGVRPKRRKPLLAVDEVHIRKQGLEGDHYSSGGKRSVTLIQYEHLAVIAALLGREHCPRRHRPLCALLSNGRNIWRWRIFRCQRTWRYNGQNYRPRQG